MRAAITIDLHSATPIHRQIYQAWREGILRGRFARDTRVPSTRELANTLGIARSTVTQAFEQLLAEGYLYSSRGSGTFVCSVVPEKLLHAKPTTSRRVDTTQIRLAAFGARLTEDSSFPAHSAGTINFAPGLPDQALFPSTTWRRLMTRHLRSERAGVFQQAENAQGYEQLRSEIAGYVGRSRAVHCTPEQVIIVNGSQQGLDLCARLLLDPGDEVAIENPGYLGARQVFAACGAKLRPVSIDAGGIVCDGLGSSARAVYVTPSHQFPTGIAMSLPRRLQLIAWARDRSAVVIEDDYDSEYRYGGAPLPALQGLAPAAPVIYCGTFSKVMFPGLRVGYLIVPQNMIAVCRRAKWLTDSNTSMLEQYVLADFLREGHLERHIRRMRRVYASRREALLDSLQRHFGDQAAVMGDTAGMHVFVRINDAALAERARRNRVHLRSAAVYYLGAAPPNEFVFGFASLNERTIREGVKRIAA